jgi:hypothetical protein
MRVHSILSMEAREAIAEAGGENARSRHGSLLAGVDGVAAGKMLTAQR